MVWARQSLSEELLKFPRLHTAVCLRRQQHNKTQKSSSKQHHIGVYSLCMLMMMIYEQNASYSSSQQSDSGEEWKRSIKISSESFGACVCDPSDETDNEYAQFLIRISFGISIMLHRDRDVVVTRRKEWKSHKSSKNPMRKVQLLIISVIVQSMEILLPYRSVKTVRRKEAEKEREWI